MSPRKPKGDKPTYDNGGLRPELTGRGICSCGGPTANHQDGRWAHSWCRMGVSIHTFFEALRGR